MDCPRMYGELRHPLLVVKSGFYAPSCTYYMKRPAELWLCLTGRKLVVISGTWDNGSDLFAISFVAVPTAAYSSLNQGELAILVCAMQISWPEWWSHSDRYQETVLTWTVWRFQIKYCTWLYKSLSFAAVVVGGNCIYSRRSHTVVGLFGPFA